MSLHPRRYFPGSGSLPGKVPTADNVVRHPQRSLPVHRGRSGARLPPRQRCTVRVAARYAKCSPCIRWRHTRLARGGVRDGTAAWRSSAMSDVAKARPHRRGVALHRHPERRLQSGLRRCGRRHARRSVSRARIVHDLRRSGVKHRIDTSENDPHTAMAFSGHSTPSILRRYRIIDLDVMRHAAERASARRSDPGTVTPLRDRPTSALPR